MQFTSYSAATMVALAGLATAHHPQSVATETIKLAFEESGIVPNVISSLDPSVAFYGKYINQEGGEKMLTPGVTMIPSEAATLVGADTSEFSIELIENATTVTPESRFLIYMIDADAPSRNDPSARNLRHWLAGNFTLTQQPAILETAMTLAAGGGEAFTEFEPPQPEPNTGIHRYIMALYQQPARFNTRGFEAAGMSERVENWNLTAWREQLGLDPALSATYFMIDSDPNAVVAAASPLARISSVGAAVLGFTTLYMLL